MFYFFVEKNILHCINPLCLWLKLILMLLFVLRVVRKKRTEPPHGLQEKLNGHNSDLLFRLVASTVTVVALDCKKL